MGIFSPLLRGEMPRTTAPSLVIMSLESPEVNALISKMTVMMLVIVMTMITGMVLALIMVMVTGMTSLGALANYVLKTQIQE